MVVLIGRQALDVGFDRYSFSWSDKTLRRSLEKKRSDLSKFGLKMRKTLPVIDLEDLDDHEVMQQAINGLSVRSRK